VVVRFTALLIVLIVVPAAYAHALGATVTLRGQRVEVEAYYSDDTPARDANVMVHDKGGRFVATGKTDDHGRWVFDAPPAGRYSVVVDAGAGHRKIVSVTIPGKPPGDAVTVSDGPGRAEFTRFPWGPAALGLAIIAALAVGWRMWLRRRANGPAES
jgi:nickel transport protein